MALVPGTRIGGYEVGELVGAGGMGEVYRARDTRLGRDVAIKVLAPHIAADRDGVVRFEREARALASLNHPNIAAIYDVVEHAGQPALVLEYVDGETLADRIALAPLTITVAVDYAKQIADALDTAHEAGIVHRDLKPGNIKITEDGRVKVLDFGLAKAVAVAAGRSPDDDPSNSPTITVHGLSQNVILGTAAYMSPEQARGKRLDKRTDIWAFGCVLFEMLTGKRAFTGETTSDVIAAIIERQPDLDRLPRSTPAPLRRIIERCLDKDPRRRIRDIAEARVDLDDAITAQPAPASSRRRTAVAASVIVALLLGAAAWYELSRRAQATAGVEPLEFTFPLALAPSLDDSWPTASPDGRRIAFAGRGTGDALMIWIRNVQSATPVPLPGTDGVSGQMFWSPDGRHLGFRAAGRLKRVRVDGGPVQIICPLTVHVGGTWSKDDIIVIAPENRGGLWKVPAGGGELEPLTKLDVAVENSHRWPHFLPDGRHFVFTVRTGRGVTNALRVGSLDSSETTQLSESQSNAVYANGYLLYAKDGALLAHAFDASTRTLHGSPQAIAGGVLQNTSSAMAAFSASADGRLLTYLRGTQPQSRLIWFDRAGRLLAQLGEPRLFFRIVLSHDEKRVAFSTIDADRGTHDIWVADAATGVIHRVTDHPATDWWPAWSPDDREIAFASDRAGQSTIFKAAADGTGGAQQIYRGDVGVVPVTWLADGRLLFFRDVRIGELGAMLAAPVGRSEAPETVLSAPSFRINEVAMSPDGQLLAFVAFDREGSMVYVQKQNGERIKISSNGVQPFWRRDGRELYFATPQGDIMAVPVSPGPVFSQPSRLMRPCQNTDTPAFSVAQGNRKFAMTADGQRVLAICDGVITPEITVALGWRSRLP